MVFKVAAPVINETNILYFTEINYNVLLMKLSTFILSIMRSKFTVGKM
jgi:hypothetical protein